MSQLKARALSSSAAIPYREAFEALFVPEPNCGCCLWIGAIRTKDYGNFKVGDEDHLAHRVSYAIYKGDVSAKSHILHTCDVGFCVNPDHLYEGTHQQNMDDRGKRGRSRGGDLRGIECAWAKIDEAAVRAIRSDDRPGSIAAAEFGISPSQFYRIKRRERWSHLD